MKPTEQTLQQVERALRKISEKFPADAEATLLTDIHLRVTQETGELMAFDDDDNELTRCIVEQWIDNKEDGFYDDVAATLRSVLGKRRKLVEGMSILKPYAFVLENDDHEHLAELHVVDDDTIIFDHSQLMEGLGQDLDRFIDHLLREE